VTLTGREHFFAAWRELVLSAVNTGPLLDLGTSRPYQKEMEILRGATPGPYFCLDVAAATAVDVVASGHHLPLRSKSIGSIVCSHVLEHVERPDLVIAEMHRVLRPGCDAYMTFPDTYPYHARPGVYPDYYRFKRDAIDMLLRDWSSFTVLAGGGLGQIAVNSAPARLKPAAQVVANYLDPRMPNIATPFFYISARR
jgi:SAM-dependent methyltransferase